MIQFCASLGALCIPTVFLIALELKTSLSAAFLAALLVFTG
jgi:dolichyl-phosphate-mannose--protein O-mannosyl transferase